MRNFIRLILVLFLTASLLPANIRYTKAEGISPEQEEQILDGKLKLTYSMFGAKGDGKTNDYEAVRAAHTYANSLYNNTGITVTVFGEKGKNYYISTTGSYEAKKSPVEIITDVDWQNCTFTIDDYADQDKDGVNDIHTGYPVFNVVSDMKNIDGGTSVIDITAAEYNTYASEKIGPELKDASAIISAVKNSSLYKNQYHKGIKKDFDRCTVWAAFVEDNGKRWRRKGTSESSWPKTGEIITFNSETGEILTNIDFEYPDLYRLRVFPIRKNNIRIGNAKFITKTNNVVYTGETQNSYTNRGINVEYTGNVSLHDITHTLDEKAHPYTDTYQKNSSANAYYGFIYVKSGSYISLDSVRLSAHTPCLQKKKTDTYIGTYDLAVDNGAYLYMNDLGYSDYSTDILDDSRWGMIGTNQTKAVFVENSTINRFDAHRGITDLYIYDSTVGVKGLTIDGQGKFYAEKVTFDTPKYILQLRADYGACWDGDMYFRDITFNLGKEPASALVNAENQENWYFGNTAYFPNLYFDTLTINGGTQKTLSLLYPYVYLKSSADNSDRNKLYYWKGNIQAKNIRTNNITSIYTFYDQFAKYDFNYMLSSYGGTNKVTLDLDSKVILNGNINVSGPKFVKGKVTGNFDGTKKYLKDLYQKGRVIFDTTDDSYMPAIVSFTEEEYAVNVSEQLQLSVAPKNVAEYLDYESSDPETAEVSSDGIVTGIREGTAVITASFKKKPGRTFTCTVSVYKGVTRLYGKGRYETSVLIAEQLKKALGIDQFDTVILASGSKFADALSGSYLAYISKAPIIITKESISADINTYIRGSLAEGGKIYVLGGESAVPASCLQGLESYEIRRLAGDNRYLTSLEILKECSLTDEPLLIATGTAFPDSLSASAARCPILLVNGKAETLNDEQKEFIYSLSGNVHMIGGTSAVSENICDFAEQLLEEWNAEYVYPEPEPEVPADEEITDETELNEEPGVPQEEEIPEEPEEPEKPHYESPRMISRIAGDTRYQTSIEIAKAFAPAQSSVTPVLAYSNKFPDGLCGGPLAAAMEAPILLTRTDKKDITKEYLEANEVYSGYVLGGDGFISDDAATDIFSLPQNINVLQIYRNSIN